MNSFVSLFLNSGYSVIPLEYQSKKPLIKWTPYQRAPADTEQVHLWFSQPANLGIVTGYNHLAVLDFDDFGEYAHWLVWIAQQPSYAIVRNAFRVRSSRGVHVYVRTAQIERNRHIDKIDIKGLHGLVVGPGSVHPSGAIYTPLNDFFIPTVTALSDVLPTQLLLSSQGISPIVNPPQVQPVNDDPWEAVNHGWKGEPGVSLVEAIRQRFKIEQFFKTPLTKTGEHFFVTRCPFHDDQEPSFWIDTQHEVCSCFKCNFGKPWDVINLYAALFGLSNLEALWELSRML